MHVYTPVILPILKFQYDIPVVVCTVLDDGQRYCAKHVECYSKNKFEKLVHLVGFIIRIYRDERSPECQICHCLALYRLELIYILFKISAST